MRISHNRLRQMVKEEYTQAARSTGIISESKIRYKLYEAALETGLSSSQYHALMSEGLLDWVKNALTNISAGKEVAGDLKRMFADKKNQVIYQNATQEIQKAVAELFKTGAAAGVDKTALKDWLVAGINKMTEDAAEAAPAADEKAKQAGEAKPGTPVDSSKPETAVPMLTAAAAQAAGQDEEKAKEQAAEKNVDVTKATQILAKAIAQQAGADAGLAAKVIDWLIQNKHMVAESGGHVTAQHILKAVKSSLRNLSTSNNGVLLERWNKLAGLIKEADLVDEKKFEKLFDEIEKALKIDDPKQFEDLKKIIGALDSLESIEIK